MAPHPIRSLKPTALRLPAAALVALMACFAGSAVAQGQGQLATPAQATPVSASASGKVVVAGVVPDEATRVAVLTRLRDVYGAERVVDQLSLGSVVAPPHWASTCSD